MWGTEVLSLYGKLRLHMLCGMDKKKKKKKTKMLS